MSAKEMFEELGFTYKKECYEHPLCYDKKRQTNSIFELDEDSFAFYSDDKTITVWKDGHCFLLEYAELQAINKQVEELGWGDK